MLTAMDTTMAEPGARSRQALRAFAPDDAPSGLGPDFSAAQSAIGKAISELEGSVADIDCSGLSEQEKLILDDLVLGGASSIDKLDLPPEWYAYCIRGICRLFSDPSYFETLRQRVGRDEQSAGWLTAVRQLWNYLQTPDRVPRNPSVIARGIDPDRLTEDLCALARRLAAAPPPRHHDEAAKGPSDFYSIAIYLRRRAESLAVRYAGDPNAPSGVDGWLSSFWRFLRTDRWKPVRQGHEPKVRLHLVNEFEIKVDDLISLDDAAEYLGVSKGRVSQLVADGTLRKFPLGERFYLLAKGDLDRYAESARRLWARPSEAKASSSAAEPSPDRPGR